MNDSLPIPVVGIIGGGASGVLAAIHLLRQSPSPLVHIFNDREELGRGVAYSPPSDRLVLNVRAGGMSAYPEHPAHFLDWLRYKCPGRFTSDCFVPRHIYGDYLRETLGAAENGAEGKLHAHPHQADRLEPTEGGWLIHDRSGTATLVHSVILALGNAPPATPHLEDDRFKSDPRYFSNAWRDGARFNRIGPEEAVVILGSGLTAVDSVLQLREQGHQGKIEIISRRGQWPELHIAGLKTNVVKSPDLIGLAPAQAMHRLRLTVRDWQKQEGNWRHVIDSIRPDTNKIWARWTTAQRRSFIRHARPYWDRHRHRTCPEVWLFIQEQIEMGTLSIRAGQVRAITPQESGLEVRFSPRGFHGAVNIPANYVLNCTGSENLRRDNCQLIVHSLLDQDLAQLDPLGLGLLTDDTGAVLAPGNKPAPNLYAIGPTRRGSLWETTAVPEIRGQAMELAKRLSTS